MYTLHRLTVRIIMLVALITLPVTGLAETSNAVDPDLVGLWHMDGNWEDSSGNGNNALPYNGVTFSTDSKTGTRSGSFDGSTSYAAVPDSALFKFDSSITVELWAKSSIRWDGHTNWVYLVQKRNMNDSGFGIFINADTPSVVFSVVNISGVASYVFSSGLLPDTWYHIAGTYDGSSARIYINGELQNSVAASGTISTNTLDLEIGRWRGAYGEYYNGLIDEVAIYKRALTAAEIQDHYRANAVNSPTVNPVPSPTATPSITLSGTKPANTAIVVNGNILVPQDATESWKVTYELSTGPNNLSITAVDSQNFNSLPATLTVVLDAAAPLVTATVPVNLATLRTAPGSVSLTLADAVSPLDLSATLRGATVTNASGYTVAGTWDSAGSGMTGTVTFSPAAAFPEGSYTATINPTDSLGNGASSSITFIVDSTPPVAPGIDPVAAPISTTGRFITGTKSSDSASVAVNCAAAMTGPVSYPTATTWSVYVSGLKEGSNVVTASSVDAAGNRSATATATITCDTTPPTVSATSADGVYPSAQVVALAANEPATIYYTLDGSTPTLSSTVYDGPVSISESATLRYFGKDLAGNQSEIKIGSYVIDTTPPVLAVSTLCDGAYTNNDTLNIAGTVTDDTGVTGVTVNGTAVQLNGDGSFSHALPLKEGGNSITVAAKDGAGHLAEETRTVTLDRTAPVMAVTAPADNSRTGKALLEVSGTADSASFVTVRINGISQNAVMNGAALAASGLIEPGYNTIEIIATDLAGNQSFLKRTVVLDYHLPSLAVTFPSQDMRTNQSSLTMKGRAADALTAVGVTISKDSDTFMPAVSDGIFEQQLNFAEERTYSLVVTATNELGSSTSVQRNVIYDITAPVLSVDPLPAPVSRPSLSVTGRREAGLTVTVTSPTAVVGEVSYPSETTWLVGISGLREGKNVISAAAADAAGNAVTATAEVIYTSKPVEIRVTATPDVIWPPDHRMVPVVITGGVGSDHDDRTVKISVSDEYGRIWYNDVTFGSTIMLEAWRNGNDPDGRKYTISAAVTDKDGNTTEKKATVTVPQKVPNLKKH